MVWVGLAEEGCFRVVPKACNREGRDYLDETIALCDGNMF